MKVFIKKRKLSPLDMTIKLGNFPGKGNIDWVFEDEIMFRLVEILEEREFQKLNSMLHLNEIRYAFPTDNYTRHNYLALFIKTISDLKWTMLTEKSYGEVKLREWQVMQMWALLTQLGHPLDGYEAERFVMWKCYEQERK